MSHMFEIENMSEEALKGVARDADRMIREWSLDKVRVYNVRYEMWWCWNSSGYTKDISQAGLYPRDWTPSREEDEVRPVDPERYVFDALMESLIRQGWGGL
jgi:hypothetical protein